jgi:hypothetical protein
VPASYAFGNGDDLGINISFIPPPPTGDEEIIGVPFDSGKPTCSINLLCNRNGTLKKYQIQVISKDRCSESGQFESLVANNKSLIQTDTQFLECIKKTYERKMCGIWRRLFSIKTLREIRLVSVSSAFK